MREKLCYSIETSFFRGFEDFPRELIGVDTFYFFKALSGEIGLCQKIGDHFCNFHYIPNSFGIGKLLDYYILVDNLRK